MRPGGSCPRTSAWPARGQARHGRTRATAAASARARVPVYLPGASSRTGMPRRPIARLRPLLGAVLAALVAAPAARAQQPQRPRLVVLLAIDQLPHDALLRLEPRFTGGLARLLREGAVYRGALPGVLRVDRVASLASRDTVKDAIARRWLHMLPPDLPAELVVTFRPYVTRGDSARAQHGSPHEYDAAVPVIFWGAPFRALRPAAPARVVDLAPTLAEAPGLVPSERLDGRVLRAALRGLPGPATRRRRD